MFERREEKKKHMETSLAMMVAMKLECAEEQRN